MESALHILLSEAICFRVEGPLVVAPRKPLNLRAAQPMLPIVEQREGPPPQRSAACVRSVRSL
jgi:hypothetical protein